MQNRPSHINIQPHPDGPQRLTELMDIDIFGVDWSDPTKTYMIQYNPNCEKGKAGRFWKLVECACGALPGPTNPSITLSSPEAGLYVLGESVGPVNLNALTVVGTNNIQLVTFLRGATPIHTIDPATPAGGPESYIDVGPFTTNTSWMAMVEDIAGLTGSSNTISISFENYFYRGMDPNATLAEAGIEALENSSVRGTFPGVYNFASELGSYKYFGWPTRLGQPSDPTLDFIDDDTGFPIPFQLQAGVVSITNTFGFTEDYYVYRSVNVLGGVLNIRVQP